MIHDEYHKKNKEVLDFYELFILVEMTIFEPAISPPFTTTQFEAKAIIW